MGLKSLHVGFLTPEYPNEQNPSGGLANYIQRVTRQILDRGHCASVIVLSDRTAIWEDRGVMIYEVVRPKRMLFSHRGMWRIDRFFRRHFVVYSALLQMASAEQIRRAVWRVHAQRPLDLIQIPNFSGAGVRLLKNGRCPIVCRLSSYEPLFRAAEGKQRTFGEYITDWFEVRQILEADAVFAPSKLLAQFVEHIEGRKIDVLRTPLDDYISSSNLDLSFYESTLKNRNYLLYFGTLKRLKGIDLLGEALPPILKTRPELLFVLIGNDQGIYGESASLYLKRKCYPHEDQLVFSPPLPKQQLLPIVQNAYAVVIPSRIDNIPNTCLEAQIMEKIVIGTRDSSLDELVIDGETGFIAENGCARSLQQVIERALRLSPAEYERMRQNIKAYVLASYREDRVGELLAYYQKTIDTFWQGRINTKPSHMQQLL